MHFAEVLIVCIACLRAQVLLMVVKTVLKHTRDLMLNIHASLNLNKT